MKKFFKVLTLTLVVATIAAISAMSLVGCGGDSKGDGEKEPYTADDLKMVEFNLTDEQYAFGIKKDNTELLNQINSIMVSKKAEIDAIMDKYLNATDEQLDTFGYDNIKTEPDPNNKDKEFVVHTNIDFKPFEYYNGKKIAGIDIEIAKLFADELGQTLVVNHNPDFSAVVTAVQTNPVYDIAMAGLTINDERKEQLNFTSPYYDSTQVIVVKKTNTLFDECTDVDSLIAKLGSLTGNQAKCGGQNGTSSYFYIKGSAGLGYDGYKNLTFKPYPGASTAATDMLNGNIEFVVVDKATGNALVKSFNNN